MNRKTLTILSILLLLIPWLIFYHDYLFFGKIYVASTPHALTPGAEGTADIRQSYQRDRSMVLYPEWTLVHFYQKTGASPYWNPYQFSGMPLIPQSSFMDPLRFALGALFGSFFFADTLYMLAMMLRSALALIFVFLIFRHFKISSVWSSAGAVAFWFNAPILILHHRTFDPLYLWVLIIWINLKLWSAPDLRRRLLWGLGLALALAAEILSWHLHFSMLIAVLLIVFNAAIVFQKYRRGISRTTALVTLGIFAGAGILAAIIGVFRIWTFMDLLGYSYRTVLPKDSGGMVPYIPFGVLYFPYIFKFQNALTLFTSVQLHPIHPELKRVIGSFDHMQIVFFPIIKTFGQIEALYRSPVWYLTLPFVFLERKTRQQAFPFWASYLFIFVGYNSVAFLSLLFRNALPTMFQAFNWSYLVVTATHTCLAICFGFGLIGLWRTLRLCQIQSKTSQAGIGAIFASISRNKLISIFATTAGMMLVGYGMVYLVWKVAYPQPPQVLYSLVSAMYNRTAPGFLSELIRGAHPLEHYYTKLGYFWESLYTVLAYFFLVFVPVLILSIWAFRFNNKPKKLSQIRFRLFKVLCIATVLLAEYGMTYVLLGFQLHRNADYISEKLHSGLLSSELDPEISRHTSSYFQNALQELYDPLPGICFLLLGITTLGLILLWYVAYHPHRRTPVLLSLTLLLGIEGTVVTLHQEDRASRHLLSPGADWIRFLQDRIGHSRYLVHGREESLKIKTAVRTGEGSQQIYDLSLAGLAAKKYGLLKPSVDLLLQMENLEGSSPLVSNDYRIFTYASEMISSRNRVSWTELLQGRTEMQFPFYKTRAFDLLSHNTRQNLI